MILHHLYISITLILLCATLLPGCSRHSEADTRMDSTTTIIMSNIKYLAIKSDILHDHYGVLETKSDYIKPIQGHYGELFTKGIHDFEERHGVELESSYSIQNKNRLTVIIAGVCMLILILSVCVYYKLRLKRIKQTLNELRLKKETAEIECDNLRNEKERLALEKKNIELERDAKILEVENLSKEREKLLLENKNMELQRDRDALLVDNLRMEKANLENEQENLRELLMQEKEMAKPLKLKDVILQRLEMLNGLLAMEITKNESYAKPYREWRDSIVKDKDLFMDTLVAAINATYPRFIPYLESHGLTDFEIRYLSLYVIGLRGKEVGEFINLKRHYNVSTRIRKKLEFDENSSNLGLIIRRLIKEI